jgi:rRNA maturation endonuclease Nob1
MFKKINIPKNTNLVFDTNIFLMGLDFNILENKIYTVPGVLDELKVDRYLGENTIILQRIKCGIQSKNLFVKTPRSKFRDTVVEAAKSTNDLALLSEVDLNLISLTLELKRTKQKNVILFTNDYSMENVCLKLDIPFSPLGKDGITKLNYKKDIVCPACGEKNPIGAKDCKNCGTTFS